MKAYDIVGYVFDGSMYHEGCQPAGETECPIFADSELGPEDYCDKCLHEFLVKNPGQTVPDYVYFDADAARLARKADGFGGENDMMEDNE